jgi:hypothetical protein
MPSTFYCPQSSLDEASRLVTRESFAAQALHVPEAALSDHL